MFKFKTISILIFIFVIGIMVAIPVFASTSEGIKFIPSTTIPGSEFVAGDENTYIDSSSLGKYILAIYDYSVSLVSVLAVVMIMFGGYKWIFAAGNASSIASAKSTIFSALIGLALVLGSYMLLNTINPALTSLKPLYTPKPVIATCPIKVRTCDDINNYFALTEKKDRSLAYEYFEKKYAFNSPQHDNSFANPTKELINKMCFDPDVQQSCGIYEGMCYINSNSENSFCDNVINISCNSNVNCTKEKTGGTKDLFCQTYSYKCSFMEAGSLCANKEECKKEITGLDCIDHKCGKKSLK